MPILLTILGIDEGPSKAFKLDLWAIDEFYVERTPYRPLHLWE